MGVLTRRAPARFQYSVEQSAWKILAPRIGLALTLFDGERTLQEVAEDLRSILESTAGEARALVSRVVQEFYAGPDKALVDSADLPDRDWKIYDPAAMITETLAFHPNKRLNAPLSLVLMPFTQCTVDCRYCYAERKPIRKSALLPVERWRELLAEASDTGIDIAVFSGGDPMLYPNILSLLDTLVAHDFNFLVSTKSEISRDIARQLSDIGLGKRFFQISLDGWTDSTTDYMVRSAGYRDRAIASIDNLTQQGIRVQINTVCTPTNYHEAPRLVRKVVEMGVKKVNVTIYGRSLYRHDDGLFLGESGIAWLRDEISRLAEAYPHTPIRFTGAVIDYNRIPLEQKKQRWVRRATCSGGRSSMTICADGRVLLCEQMPHNDEYTAGSLTRQGLLDVWNSPATLRLAFPPREMFEGTVCQSCDEFEECHNRFGYCFRDSLNAYGSVFQPPPSCPKAPPSPRFA